MVARQTSRDASLAEELLDHRGQERKGGSVSHAGQEDDGHCGPVAGLPWPVPWILAVERPWRVMDGLQQ